MKAIDINGAVTLPGIQWASEKYDGIQGRWNGRTRTLITKSGRVLSPPADWCDGMPSESCVGELWMGYGTTSDDAASLLRCSSSAVWDQASFMCFEGAEGCRGNGTFEALDRETGSISDYYAAVIERGGEGVVACIAGELFKIKPIQDAEAVVIGTTPGKYSWRIAALVCRVVNGPLEGTEIRLSAGLSESQRTTGSTPTGLVRFRWDGVAASGQPTGCVFLGVRDEATMA